MTESSEEGWADWMLVIAARMVLAIFAASLLLLDLRLFEPTEYITLQDCQGNPHARSATARVGLDLLLSRD